MTRVRVTYVRDLGVATQGDLTARIRVPIEGQLIQLRRGAPLMVTAPGLWPILPPFPENGL